MDLDSLELEKFRSISKQLLSQCNSDAYVFINLPGITANDFSDYKEEFISLQRYIYSASTALSFERIESPSNDTYDELMDFASERCKIEKFLTVDGNDTSSFEPYIDSAKRVVRIDYPMLPDGKRLRREAIARFDKSLRSILAQIPSPAQTVILSSIEPCMAPERTSGVPAKPIFPEILLDPSRRYEIEKNDRDLKVPRNFNEHRPRFAEPESRYISVFDSEFISNNYDLIRLITTSLIGFLLIQLFVFKSRTRPSVGLNTVQKQADNEASKTEHRNESAKKTN